jgi:hypothetical protein
MARENQKIVSDALRGILSETGRVAELPGDVQIRIDIHVCLLDAIADQFGIARKDIKPDTVPSEDPIAALAVGWGMCLARFERYLHELRPLYAPFDHQERYTGATLDLSFSEIKEYLYQRLIEQLDEALG